MRYTGFYGPRVLESRVMVKARGSLLWHRNVLTTLLFADVRHILFVPGRPTYNVGCGLFTRPAIRSSRR